MRKLITFAVLAVLASAATADPVVDAYDKALAAGKVALADQKRCEEQIQKGKQEACKESSKSYQLYRARAKQFTTSVEPHDLLNHVTPQQMDQITLITNQIGASMDYVSAYLDSKK